MIGLTSFRLARLPHLSTFLGGTSCRYVTPWNISRARQITGWGLKRSGLKAVWLATLRDCPPLLLEDGFLRSVHPSDPPLSIIVEQGSTYYDTTQPGKLDRSLQRPLTQSQRERVSSLIKVWQDARVSKYNHLPDYKGPLPKPYVLIADQLQGDASVRHGMAAAASFRAMLEAALEEHPSNTIVVKAHPLAGARRRKGYLNPACHKDNSRILFVTEPCSPVRIIEEADAVYTVTSQLGFEALIHGKRVRTFGMPFYAGRGLTEDALPAPHWREPCDLDTLVHACLIDLPRYVDPETGQRCEVEMILEHLALQRRMRERFPATVYAVGFSLWKRHYLKRFLSGSRIRFVRSVSHCPRGSTFAVWGSEAIETAPGSRVLRIEDGFLRSVGLGADLKPPLSWCIDDLGMYFNPRTPSRLEHLLSTTTFDEKLLTRAKALREQIVAAGITKYNLSGTSWRRPPTAKRVILVPGQVEDDASVLLGTGSIRTNLELVRAVRAANPDAWIVHKPHPDVAARLRQGGHDMTAIAQFCDEVVTDASINAMLTEVDEVHTLTSLTGFEALLRGRRVTCYGTPFYAGWGLTTDLHPQHRRQRQLTLDELVATALILYPTYLSSRTGRYTTPERTVEEIISLSQNRGGFKAHHLARPFLRLQLHRRFRRRRAESAQETT